MNRSLQLDRRAFLRGLGGVALALPVLDAMGAEVTDQIPRRFCAHLHRQRHVAAENRERYRRVELVSRRRKRRRVRIWQVHRTAGSVPQAAELYGRTVASERSESRSAHLLRHVAHRGPAAQSKAGNLQLRRTRSGGRAAYQTVLPATLAGAVHRRRHRLPVAHGDHLLQPGRQADSRGKQPAPYLRPLVPRRPHVPEIRA